MQNNKQITKNLIGRPYWQAPILAARIDSRDCVAHHLVAVKAIESACGIEISGQTTRLRKLMLATEIIKNHTFHLYFRVLPDFLNFNSESELSHLHPDLFSDTIKLKKFADKILTVVGGRSIHPITSVAGGFKSYPKKSQLKEILANSAQITETALKTLRLFVSLNLPKSDLISDFAALHKNNNYAFYDGEIWTGKGKLYSQDDFHKFAQKNQSKILVGALARYNLSQSHFDPTVKKILGELKIAKKISRISEITLARAIENYYLIILSIQILSGLVQNGLAKEHIVPPQKFSTGISAIESTDGTVIHSCELDKDGIIIKYEIDALCCS